MSAIRTLVDRTGVMFRPMNRLRTGGPLLKALFVVLVLGKILSMAAFIIIIPLIFT
jgi:hypothetical protein